MRHDSALGTCVVAFCLCVVCSVIVSSTAVSLRPRQLANKELEKKRNVLMAAGLYEEGREVESLFGPVERQLIDLTRGQVAVDGVVDLDTFNPLLAAKDPELGVAIPSEQDLAGIKRRSRYAFAYLVKKDGQLDQVVLPVYGKGLWSTLYGFLSLDRDLATSRGITFYEHRETPGLGGEVDNPDWKATWRGKSIRDASGKVHLEVLRGRVDPRNPGADHQIDGLSGATITSRGVQSLIRYWLGPHGFGPFLNALERR